MSRNQARPTPGTDCDVMAAVDDGATGEQLVIAELCREEAYLTMSTEATVDIDEWR